MTTNWCIIFLHDVFLLYKYVFVKLNFYSLNHYTCITMFIFDHVCLFVGFDSKYGLFDSEIFVHSIFFSTILKMGTSFRNVSFHSGTSHCTFLLFSSFTLEDTFSQRVFDKVVFSCTCI